MVQIFLTLTSNSGFNVQINIVITANRKRDSTVELSITGTNAGGAGNAVAQTLTTNPSYLQQQDPSLGDVRSVSVTTTSATTAADSSLPLGAIIGIAVGGAALLAAVITVIVIAAVRANKRKKSLDFAADVAMDCTVAQELSDPAPNPAYGQLAQTTSPRFTGVFDKAQIPIEAMERIEIHEANE